MSGHSKVAVSLALEDLDRAFPFALLFNGTGIIQHIGPSLAKLTQSTELIGKPVFEVLNFKKPRRVDPEQLLQNILGQRLTCELRSNDEGRPVLLFGSVFNVLLDAERLVLVALTPGISTQLVIEEKGLHLSDFGPADGSADLLPLLAVQTEMLEDSKKKTARLEAARADMERLANEDSLTGLPNRRALLRQLSNSLEYQQLSIIHIDLDHFKDINDTFGHAAGDAALRHAAAAMCRVCDDAALCARLGGDEFVVILAGEYSDFGLQALAQKMIAELSAPFEFESEQLSMSASAGIAQSHPNDGLSSDELLQRADLALYEIKRTGRGKALLCTPDLLETHTSFQLLTADIRRGLSNGEFVAHLQPQVRLDPGMVVGFEALARWEHPTRGLLAPVSFLGAIKRAGMIRELDEAVRKSAFAAFMSFEQEGISLPKLSLNVTIDDLLDPQFHDTLSWEIDAYDLAPNQIVLEIVESVFFEEDSSQILNVCNTLKARGFKLALDDFGTGHASILSLVQIPISIVKVDRAFTSGISKDVRKQTLASSMIDMASSLNLTTLAEGVEDAEDIEILRDFGCLVFQGYYFGRAMSHNDSLAWMRNWIKAPATLRSA